MSTTRKLSLTAAILMLLMVALTGLSYFSYDGGRVSISGYVWFPTEHAEFETYLASQIEGYNVNDAVGIPIFIQIFGVVCAALLIWKGDKPWTAWTSVGYGLIGGIGYLSSSFLKLGGAWGLHLALLVIILALGGVALYMAYRERGESQQAQLSSHSGEEVVTHGV